MTVYPLTVRAGDATANASLSVRRGYGVNAHVLDTVQVKTGGLTGVTLVKVFNYTPGIPTTWPGPPASEHQPVPEGAQALVCFMPPVADLLAGKLDAQLKAWLAQAPEGSMLTGWQEGNEKSNGIWKQPGVKTAADVAAMHAYLRDFCATHAPHVAYGADIGSDPIYTTGQDCTAYVPEGLAWYSFDGYDRPNQDAKTGEWVSPFTAGQVFAGLGQVRAKWPTARLLITETNTHRVIQDPSTAGQWFTDVYEVGKQYGVSAFATWWGPHGTSVPRFKLIEFTPGAAYVAALNAIAADCAA